VGASPRTNFDSIGDAMLTVFVLLIGDNWNYYMADYIRATSFTSCIYSIVWCAFGNIILLNLFLAMLLKNFDK
jgi:hypothetical protein